MGLVAQALFSSLSIETTRKCNQKCEHCMRGDAQNVVFDPKTFDEFCGRHNLRYFKILWLNGGEPSLAPSTINDILDVVEHRNIWVERFGIGTNGTRMDVMMGIAYRLSNMYGYIRQSDICMSSDPFHKKPWGWCDGAHSMLGSVHFITRGNNTLLPVGRGANLGSEAPFTHDVVIHKGSFGDVLHMVNNSLQFLSLACDGRLLCGLDLPYGVDDSHALLLAGEALHAGVITKEYSIMLAKPRTT